LVGILFSISGLLRYQESQPKTVAVVLEEKSLLLPAAALAEAALLASLQCVL
jgi:hypothetical protein